MFTLDYFTGWDTKLILRRDVRRVIGRSEIALKLIRRRKKETECLGKGGNYSALNFERLLFSMHFQIAGLLWVCDRQCYATVAMVTFLCHFTYLLRLRYVLVCEWRHNILPIRGFHCRQDTTVITDISALHKWQWPRYTTGRKNIPTQKYLPFHNLKGSSLHLILEQCKPNGGVDIAVRFWPTQTKHQI